MDYIIYFLINILHSSYSVDILQDVQVLQVNMSTTLCIEGKCDTFDILPDSLIPIPFCDLNGTLALPEDVTIKEYLDQVTSAAADMASDLVLSALGIKVKLFV